MQSAGGVGQTAVLGQRMGPAGTNLEGGRPSSQASSCHCARFILDPALLMHDIPTQILTPSLIYVFYGRLTQGIAVTCKS